MLDCFYVYAVSPLSAALESRTVSVFIPGKKYGDDVDQQISFPIQCNFWAIADTASAINVGNGLSSPSARREIRSPSAVSRNERRSSTPVHDSAHPTAGHLPRRAPLSSMHAIYYTRMNIGSIS